MLNMWVPPSTTDNDKSHHSQPARLAWQPCRTRHQRSLPSSKLQRIGNLYSTGQSGGPRPSIVPPLPPSDCFLRRLLAYRLGAARAHRGETWNTPACWISACGLWTTCWSKARFCLVQRPSCPAAPPSSLENARRPGHHLPAHARVPGQISLPVRRWALAHASTSCIRAAAGSVGRGM